MMNFEFLLIVLRTFTGASQRLLLLLFIERRNYLHAYCDK